MKIRSRFAPSPTGMPHMGHLRTAAYAYVLTKHSAGDFILRIEDTDRKRYLPEAVDILKNMLKTFQMDWDEYYVQSERLDLYKKAAKQLIDSGKAFYCQCEAKNAKKEGYSKTLRDPCRDKNFDHGAIKLKVPENETISYVDFVFKEEISWNTDTVFDATLLKSDGFPTYHLAATFDDHEMGITHVLRGYDWMSSTPIHLLVYKYLGFDHPEIGHLTDIQSPEGGKLSKRKGSTSLESFIKDGYLPEALFNFVILLGWAPKDNRELFTLEEFVKYFDINGFQKSNPKFVPDKLNWFNQQYIRKIADDELAQKVKPFTKRGTEEIKKVLPLVKDRLVTLKDFDQLTDYFFTPPDPDNPDLKNARAKYGFTEEVIKQATSVLEENFDGKVLEEKGRAYCAEKQIKVGDYFMVLRLAVTGKTQTPPLWDIMQILGKEETIERLNKFNQTKSQPQ